MQQRPSRLWWLVLRPFSRSRAAQQAAKAEQLVEWLQVRTPIVNWDKESSGVWWLVAMRLTQHMASCGAQWNVVCVQPQPGSAAGSQGGAAGGMAAGEMLPMLR
jgi:hypothetical protein